MHECKHATLFCGCENSCTGGIGKAWVVLKCHKVIGDHILKLSIYLSRKKKPRNRTFCCYIIPFFVSVVNIFPFF